MTNILVFFLLPVLFRLVFLQKIPELLCKAEFNLCRFPDKCDVFLKNTNSSLLVFS